MLKSTEGETASMLFGSVIAAGLLQELGSKLNSDLQIGGKWLPCWDCHVIQTFYTSPDAESV